MFGDSKIETISETRTCNLPSKRASPLQKSRKQASSEWEASFPFGITSLFKEVSQGPVSVIISFSNLL